VKPFFAILLAVGGLTAASLPLHAEDKDSIFKKATFTPELNENQSPKGTAEFFHPEDTIYLSIELKGRPKSGDVTCKFFYKEQLIAETKLDVAEVNKGVLFSIGQNTFVGLSLKPTRPFPISSGYRAEVAFTGKPLGTFPFKIGPAKDALPSALKSVTLAKGVADHKPVNETREFTQLEKVVFAGSADLGIGTALEVNWLIDNKVDPVGTKSFVMEENKKAVPFFFSFVPESGWPTGAHEVVLLIDEKEAAREKFTIKADPNMGNTKLDVSSVSLYRDNGKGEPGEEVTSFTTKDIVLHLECTLAKPASPKGAKFIWTLIKAGDEENIEIAVAEMEETSLNRSLTSNLSTKKGLPAGEYRVDLVQGEKTLVTRNFTVK